ncbi:MAG: PD-(D/E)XK nuclease family protein [Treponema sp.]|nr:PD-(D/E)XK nuclease family protein [Treponema sp.]
MNSVESILINNIDSPGSLFVFPTDIAVSRWIDHLLRIKGGAVATNQFTAWDVFKQNSIKSKVQNKKSIPSALRKIFVSRLVNENAENILHGREPLFTSLIRTKWAGEASQFSPWLTAVLPQLGSWFNKATGLSIHDILSEDVLLNERAQKAAGNFEGDYKDMFVLAKRYAQFLKEHSLFEPAWETPPFNDDGKDVFIFFPESLSDYSEYKQLLAESDHVKIISASDTENLSCDSFFYANSRGEITEAALYIRALHEKQGIEWDSIAVCICDPDSYEPYVLREFTNRNIPFVKRTSKPLSDYPAGRFFRSVFDCTSADFSFSSLVSLVMNKKLPWKENDIIDELIQFGINNNCLFSWSEERDGIKERINVWEEAFKNPYGYFNADIRKFFGSLKNRISSFRHAVSFAELRRQYFIFREQFFNMESCPDETDLILSRCISELINLTELEKSFPDVPAVDPFLFFTDYLKEVYYLPQSKSSGVAILPYKTAAAAPFDSHIILNSSQESLSVIYSHLDFLPKKKREELGLADEDASASFLNMHKYNSVKISAFFCSEQTFSGFTIPHSKTGAPSEYRDRYASDETFREKFSQDHYKEESIFLSSPYCSEKNELQNLHENQIDGFNEWKDRRLSNLNIRNNWKGRGEIQNIIIEKFAKTGKYSVSATSLQKYFQCSLKWLFERVFSLENTQIETSLMSENISGLVYHAVLNNFFGELKEKLLLEPINDGFVLSLPDEYRGLLEQSINKTFDNFPSLNNENKSEMSSFTSRLLSAGKKDYQNNLEKALARFLSFFAGCRVYGTENYYRLERDSYIMNGFVDLILKENEEKYIIIDFKLKHTPNRADCTAEGENAQAKQRALGDFQLPMYITLTEENENVKIYTALFYSIIDLRPEVIIGTISDTNTEKIIPVREDDRIIRGNERYNKIFEEFSSKKNQFVKEISCGDYSVFPQKNIDCLDCDYHRICRTVYIIDRENITLGNF